MSRGGAIALRYARAVFGLAEQAGDHRRLLGEVEALTDEITESDELRRMLFTPLHPRVERRGVIGELAQKLELSSDVGAFARLMVDENRLHALPAVRDALRDLVDSADGRLEARITSARPLDEQEQERLREALSRRFDAQVTLALDVDPDLIGGLVARVGDSLLDASIRTQLASLGANLKKGSVS